MGDECPTIEERINNHIEQDDARFDSIAGTLEKITDNHLAHIEPNIAGIKSDIAWLKSGVMLMIGGIVAVFFKT